MAALPEAVDAGAPPSAGDLARTYGTGLLAMGLMDALIFIVPIWAVFLGANATEVGILVGARSVLPFLLAIHGGALMDRLGARRVTMFFVVLTGISAPLYPLLPWFVPLLIIQMVSGLAFSLAWIGAQTMAAQLSNGETTYLGRFSFAARIGTFAAPVLMGLLWDLTTPWITFLAVSLWAVALLAMLGITPERPGTRPDAGPMRWREVLPRLADYRATFALLLIPAIAITVATGGIRVTTSAMQTSVYVVYLEGIGLTGTAIGLLFSAIEGASALGSLLAGPARRHLPAYPLLFFTTGLSIALMAATPLMGGIFAILVAAQVIRGIMQGAAHPVLFSLQAKAVGPERQGATVALRVTSNRVTAIFIPPAVGILADTLGIAQGFYVMGAFTVGVVAVIALLSRRYR